MDIHSMWNLYVGHCFEIGVSFEHEACHAISVHQVGAHATLHTFDDNYDRCWLSDKPTICIRLTPYYSSIYT